VKAALPAPVLSLRSTSHATGEIRDIIEKRFALGYFNVVRGLRVNCDALVSCLTPTAQDLGVSCLTALDELMISS
jgi:uncharacterized Fe-S center protein